MQEQLYTNLVKACWVPFDVDLVSEAKCQERVLEAGIPKCKEFIEVIRYIPKEKLSNEKDTSNPHKTFIPVGWRRDEKWFCLASVCTRGLKCTFLFTESSMEC